MKNLKEYRRRGRTNETLLILFLAPYKVSSFIHRPLCLLVKSRLPFYRRQGGPIPGVAVLEEKKYPILCRDNYCNYFL